MPIDLIATVATIKSIAAVAKEAGKIELYNEIIGLQQSMLEMIAEHSTLVETNSRLVRESVDLKERLSSLELQLRARAEMTFRAEAYWRLVPGKAEEGPFCAKCWDGDGKVCRMTDRGNGYTGCVVCGHAYGRPRGDSGLTVSRA